jgi:hypothetical protein
MMILQSIGRNIFDDLISTGIDNFGQCNALKWTFSDDKEPRDITSVRHREHLGHTPLTICERDQKLIDIL